MGYIDLTMKSPGFEQAMFRYETCRGDWLYTNHNEEADASADREWLRRRARDYIGRAKDDDPYCSPFYICDENLRKFPPILALVGSEEIFAHETSVFMQRAKRLGVSCELQVFDGMWHDWFNFCDLPRKLHDHDDQLEAAVAAYRAVASFV